MIENKFRLLIILKIRMAEENIAGDIDFG